LLPAISITRAGLRCLGAYLETIRDDEGIAEVQTSRPATYAMATRRDQLCLQADRLQSPGIAPHQEPRTLPHHDRGVLSHPSGVPGEWEPLPHDPSMCGPQRGKRRASMTQGTPPEHCRRRPVLPRRWVVRRIEPHAASVTIGYERLSNATTTHTLPIHYAPSPLARNDERNLEHAWLARHTLDSYPTGVG